MTSIQDLELGTLEVQVEQLTDDIASSIQGGAGNSHPDPDPKMIKDLVPGLANVVEEFIIDLEPFGAIPGIVEFQESLMALLNGLGFDANL